MPKLLESSMKMTGGGNKRRVYLNRNKLLRPFIEERKIKAGMTDNRLIKAGGSH